MSPVRTRNVSVFDRENSLKIYEKFRTEISWQSGVYSTRHKKVTRMAYTTDPDSFNNVEIDIEIINLITTAMCALGMKNNLVGFYVNYYRDGCDWTPAHSHPENTQLIISLGATRKLRIGKKIYDLTSGDVTVFGSATHEVLMDPEVAEGRISIAAFLEK